MNCSEPLDGEEVDICTLEGPREKRASAPLCETFDQLENKYWSNLMRNIPIYGSDVSGSVWPLYDPEQKIWDMKNLGTILNVLKDERVR